MPLLAAIAVGDDCDLLSKALGENALLGSGFDPLPYCLPNTLFDHPWN